MPRFQPGPERYFGNTARPIAASTSRVLPFLGNRPAAPGLPGRLQLRPPKPPKPKPYVIGKTEKIDITKKLLKMPHYIPAATTKSLKTFAKQIMGNKKAFSKEERVFAEATLHRDQPIKDVKKQKAFIEGEVGALVEVKDRAVKNPFAFTHRAHEVAGQTYRSLVKDYTAKETKPSIAERRLSRNTDRDTGAPAVEAPAGGASWTAPTPLGEPGAPAPKQEPTSWTAPFAVTPNAGLHADGMHQSINSHLTHMTSGGGVDVMIISNRLNDLILRQWEPVVRRRVTHIPLATAPLLKSFPARPGCIVLDAADSPDPAKLALPVGMIPIILFAGPSQTEISAAWEKLGAVIVPEELTATALKDALAGADHPADSESRLPGG